MCAANEPGKKREAPENLVLTTEIRQLKRITFKNSNCSYVARTRKRKLQRKGMAGLNLGRVRRPVKKLANAERGRVG